MEKYYPWLLEKISRLARLTYRIEEAGRPAADAAIQHGGILLAWHCYIWVLALRWASAGYTALAGLSREGEIISRTLERLGWNVIRGSSSEGALSSLRTMVTLLKQGRQLVVTPDGPQGPARAIKMGAVMLQQLTGLPIIPVGVAARRKYTFPRTWDKFEIPLPGSRIVIYYGKPLKNLGGISRDEAAGMINQALIEANLAAERS